MCFIVLSLVTHTISLYADEDNGSSSTRFSIFIPTNRRNPAPDRRDNLRLAFRNSDPGELKEVFGQLKDFLPRYTPENPPVVPIYIPYESSPEEQEALARLVGSEIERSLGVKPKVFFRFISQENGPLQELKAALERAIADAEKSLPGDQVTRDGITRLRTALENATRESEKAAKLNRNRETRMERLTRPEFVKKAIEGLSSLRAILNLGTRGVQVYEAGFQGVGPLMAGLGMMTIDPAIEFFSTKFEVEIGRAFGDHGIPFSSRHPFLKRLNEIYQNHSAARMLKGIIGTGATYGVGRPALMQQLGHYNHPDEISAVRKGDLLTMAGASAVSSVTYYGGFRGYESLRQMGYLNQQTVDMVLRSTSFLWQFAEILLSIPRPEARGILPYVLTPMWISYAAGWLGGSVLPPNNRRIVVVSPKVRNLDQINHWEALESVKEGSLALLQSHELQTELSRLKDSDKSSRREFFTNLAKPCRAIWERLNPQGKK